MHICMFVNNRGLNDPRVTREAEVAVGAGFRVTVVAAQDHKEVAAVRQEQRGVAFIRPKVPASGLAAVVRKLRWPTMPCPDERVPDAGSAQTMVVGIGGLTGSQSQAANGVNLLRRLWGWRRSTRSLWQRLCAGLSVDADVYHAHDCDTLALGWICACLRNRPLVYDSHELWVDWQLQMGASAMVAWAWRTVEQSLCRRSRLCITVSDGLGDILRSRYRPSRLLIVRNCPRKPSADPPMTRQAARTLCSIGPNENVVIYQGGIWRNRGLDVLVRAAARLPQCRMLLVGPANDYANELAELARTCGAGNVSLLGHKEEADRNVYMSAADLGVVLTQDRSLSYRYSLANKVFEYFSRNVPVVVSDLPEYRRVIERTGAGLLCDPEDSDGLAAQIRAFFAKEPSFRSAMAERGRRAVLEELNMERQMEPVLEFYRSCARDLSFAR